MGKHDIAVFDFDAGARASTAKALRECMASGVLECADPQALAEAVKEGCRAAFIGVDSMLGVEAARLAREMDASLPLVLLSRAGEYAMEGFRLRAADYIVKPATAGRLAAALRRADASPGALAPQNSKKKETGL